MARLANNSFTSWEMTEKEKLEGSLLNVYQTYLIQTDLSNICEQLINLTFNVNNPLDNLARHAELTGQKIILQTILDRDIAAKEILAQASRDSHS